MLRYLLAPVVVLFALLAPMLLFLMAMDSPDSSVETGLTDDNSNKNNGGYSQPNSNEDPEENDNSEDESDEGLPREENA